MRMFDYYEPKTITEACDLLATRGARVLAGGTDLVVQIKHGIRKPVSVVNLKGINELEGVRFLSDSVVIGALTKISVLAESKELYDGWRSIAEGADNIGTPQIRNLATIGGNICNSSPCADTIPGLLVSDAVALITDGRHEREMKLIDFFKGPGDNCLENGEILKALRIPKMVKNTKQAFFKMGPRKAADIAVVNMAVSLSFADGICTRARIAMGSVAPTPIRALEAEKVLEGSGATRDIEEVSELVAAVASPIDDIRGTAAYRRHILKTASTRLLRELCR